MSEKDPKLGALPQQATLTLSPSEVTDQLFVDSRIFDPRYVVQAKCEMLRRQPQGQSATEVAAAFGFSRPSFYQAQSAFGRDGLVGLVPRKRRPKQAHKLTEEVLSFIGETLQKNPSVRPGGLARLIHQHLGTTVHPRSIEPALLRHPQKTPMSESKDGPAFGRIWSRITSSCGEMRRTFRPAAASL